MNIPSHYQFSVWVLWLWFFVNFFKYSFNCFYNSASRSKMFWSVFNQRRGENKNPIQSNNLFMLIKLFTETIINLKTTTLPSAVTNCSAYAYNQKKIHQHSLKRNFIKSCYQLKNQSWERYVRINLCLTLNNLMTIINIWNSDQWFLVHLNQVMKLSFMRM